MWHSCSWIYFHMSQDECLWCVCREQRACVSRLVINNLPLEALDQYHLTVCSNLCPLGGSALSRWDPRWEWGCLWPMQTGGPITPCRQTVSPCKKSVQIVTKFSKTIILLCRRILVQLQCRLIANELHMEWREWMSSGFYKPKFKCTQCAVHMCHMWKCKGCCFDKWSRRGG